jgi:hypothetical protein
MESNCYRRMAVKLQLGEFAMDVAMLQRKTACFMKEMRVGPNAAGLVQLVDYDQGRH